MQSSSLLLGRPWKFDNYVAHHGITNTYTFMHKNKKITLLPLSPADIRKHFKELADIEKNTPPTNESSDAKPTGIKLKGVYHATNFAATELCDNHDVPCYTMLCRYVSSTHDPMSCTLHPVVTNLLQEIDNGMESRTTPIQVGEDDEDIAMLDTLLPWSPPSYKSSPTRSSRLSRIQPTPLHGFGDISFIRHPNEVILDAFES